MGRSIKDRKETITRETLFVADHYSLPLAPCVAYRSPLPLLTATRSLCCLSITLTRHSHLSLFSIACGLCHSSSQCPSLQQLALFTIACCCSPFHVVSGQSLLIICYKTIMLNKYDLRFEKDGDDLEI